MKKLIVGALVSAGMLAAMSVACRKAEPRMRAAMWERCERMLEEMPESFPPKRMMAELSSIRENTAGILQLLEKGNAAGDGGREASDAHLSAQRDQG